MRLIDADALIEFCAERWIPLNIDAVNMQPTIRPENAQLYQEGTTSDLISRQDAINAAEDWYEGLICGSINGLIKKLKALPSAQQWISCSERLPEAEYPAIVTWKNDDPKSYYQYILGKHYAGVAHYKNGKWYWYSSVTEDVLMEYGRYESEEFDEAIKVLAWMPLPEPYIPEGEEHG